MVESATKSVCGKIRAERCGQNIHVELQGAGLDGECAAVWGEWVFEKNDIVG